MPCFRPVQSHWPCDSTFTGFCYRGAGNRHIKAAYLVDPVDNTKQTPEGPDYPSGVMALNQLGKPVGISGAGIVGRCNPEGSNYKVTLYFRTP